MTEKLQIAELEKRLEEIATLLFLEPGHTPDRWVGHIEARIQEWFDDREKAWAENARLRAENRKLWHKIGELRIAVRHMGGAIDALGDNTS